jgi:hypothetical protein
MMGKGGMMGGSCKMMEEMHAQMGGMMPKGDTGPSSQAYNGIKSEPESDGDRHDADQPTLRPDAIDGNC